MKKLLLALITLSWLFYFQAVVAAGKGDILINEIAWMGSANSANDEWIELLNKTDKNIDLLGWILKSSDDKIKILLKGKILGSEFYLLERTDDNSVPNIKADLIYRGALNNKGADLVLYDNLGNIVDGANYSSGWPEGDNTTKQTTERLDVNAWQTSKSPNGTPRTQNSLGATKIALQADIRQDVTLPGLEKIGNKNNEASVITVDSTKRNSSLLIFLVSLLIILASGGIILFLKFTKHYFSAR